MENKRLEEDIALNNQDDEQLAGYNCPVCGYPVVIEMGLELCYCCGWHEGMENEGYYDE